MIKTVMQAYLFIFERSNTLQLMKTHELSEKKTQTHQWVFGNHDQWRDNGFE